MLINHAGSRHVYCCLKVTPGLLPPRSAMRCASVQPIWYGRWKPSYHERTSRFLRRPQQELQLLRALARIQENKHAEAMVALQSLQHDPVANLAACTLLVYAHPAAPNIIPAIVRDAAQDLLDTHLPASPPASTMLVARMHWLTGALEAARALLDRPAAAGDPTARSLLAWVAVTHACQQRTKGSNNVLLGFDDECDAAHDARMLCDEALAACPRDPCILVAAAHAYALAGQHETATNHAAHALRLKPGWLPALLAGSAVALARSDWEAAVAVAGANPPLPLRLLVGVSCIVVVTAVAATLFAQRCTRLLLMAVQCSGGRHSHSSSTCCCRRNPTPQPCTIGVPRHVCQHYVQQMNTSLSHKHRVATHLASLGDPAALTVAAALTQHAAQLQPDGATTQRITLLVAAHGDGQLPVVTDVGSASGLLDAALASLWAGRLHDAHQSLELAALAGGGNDAHRRSLQALLGLLEGSDAEARRCVCKHDPHTRVS